MLPRCGTHGAFSGNSSDARPARELDCDREQDLSRLSSGSRYHLLMNLQWPAAAASDRREPVGLGARIRLVSPRRSSTTLLLLAVLVLAGVSEPGASDPPDQVPLLVVLSETGRQREGLPVLEPDPSVRAVEDVLLRGFSGRLLRLHRMVRHYLWVRDGEPVEPAYLLFSRQRGGFPRYGFFLGDEPKRGVGYVELRAGQRPSGRFGAVDQIFPHELVHIIASLLAGPPAAGESGQIHAVGVRTDPQTAFNEGFAEHVQIMAVDDPGAAEETRALAEDAGLRARTWEKLERYEEALTARWSPAPRARMTFPLWYSGVEQALRYHAVKENLYALQREIPDRLLRRGNAYEAYLVDNVLPGRAGDPVKGLGRLVSTEGVVAGLFYRWLTDEGIRGGKADPEAVALFGPLASDADDLDAAYLKVFRALDAGRPTELLGLVQAYRRLYPGDDPAVDHVLAEVLGRVPGDGPEPLWLANPWFETGTSLFDQFAGLPRRHTFDLNASSVVDLITVPGVDASLAGQILRSGPYSSIDDLEAVSGLSPAVLRTFASMEDEMRHPGEGSGTDGLSLTAILRPYILRAILVWLIAGILSAALYHAARRVAWWRAGTNGLVCALVGLAAGWSIDPGHGLLAVVVPAVLLGVPAATWKLARRNPADAARVLAAWTLAAIPAAVAIRPWF